MTDPVAKQLDAYNSQDIDSFCACYHDDVAIEDGNGVVLSTGVDILRTRYGAMFAQHPNNRAELVARMRVGPWVVDEELVTGRGPAPLRAIAIYRVHDGKIASVRFLVESDQPRQTAPAVAEPVSQGSTPASD
jgi:hypothetical protein